MSTDLVAPFGRIAIVGCGLVGGSVARAATALGDTIRVVVTDADPAVVAAAAERGVGTDQVIGLEDAVAEAELVVVAVPVAHVADVVSRVASAVRPGTIITDVGSVKAAVVADVTARLAGTGVSFIGGHPMAGSERSGVEAADGQLFQGATWLLTPTGEVAAADFERLAAFLRGIGARVLALDVELHDRLVAIASHLPQVLASTLMDEAGEAARRTGEAVLAVAGGGFRDATRIAASDPDLWVGILRQNRLAVLDAIDGFLDRLGAVRAAIADSRWDDVRDALDRGRVARQQLPTKERVGDLVDLVIAVDDRPAVLAVVTTALGEAGVNIEDLAMRHASSLEAGSLVVAVDGHAAAERALRLLSERGFSAHLEAR